MNAITIDIVIRSVSGIERPTLERWIDEHWVRPDPTPRGYVFTEIDLARIRLIHELVTELRVPDDTMPVILGLLDQVYDLRRRLHAVSSAIVDIAPPETHTAIIARLRE